jgi:Tol biopolymer transport system component
MTTDGTLRFGIAWTQDDKAIVYATAGLAALYRVSMRTQPEQIEAAGFFGDYPTISNNRLAFSRDLTDVDIWRFQVGGESEPFIRSSASGDWAPQFSPDGQTVAFTSNRTGNSNEIWVVAADGSNPKQVTHGPGHQGSARWSPDGRLLAFDAMTRDGIHLYTMESAGGGARQLTSGRSLECQPSWSRDGNWIYFQSDRTGRLEIWRCPFPAGTREQWQQMTTGGGDVAFESSDGKTLYYTTIDGQLCAKPLAGGSPQKLIDKVTRGFGVLEKGIFYCGANGQDGKVPVLFYDFSSRSTRELTRITASGAWGGFAVSPDGKTILFSASLTSERDLMLIENFR